MARALLDINVLIALLDQGHVLHAAAAGWLARELDHGWATCPITENGLVRTMAQLAYPNPQLVALVDARLAEACCHPSHGFLSEPISLLQDGLIRWERLLGPRAITDAYLLALAVHHGARFTSFDQRIAIDVVPTAEKSHLCIIEESALGRGPLR